MGNYNKAMNLDLGLTRKIIEVCRLRSINLQRAAYILATAYWETAKTMEPVREGFYLGSKAVAFRKKLRYSPWYGRGLVQLTWKENYAKASKRLGVDFLEDPDLVMKPDYSVRILVIGMEEGWFTGKSLADKIDDLDESDEEDKKEYVAARTIVNGKDRASEIAMFALQYEEDLRRDGYLERPDPDVKIETPKEETTPETKKPWWMTLISILLKLVMR